MRERGMIVVGGMCFIVGALAFVVVFTYLAANFDYPAVLDGTAVEVLPRLRSGRTTMRAVWAVYAFLPLILVPGANATFLAFPASRGRMTLALVFASIGSVAMCLGLMRWPSVHWALAEAFVTADSSSQASIAAVFNGLNLYLGNYVGEFLGELCLAIFFMLTGISQALDGPAKRLGWAGTVFGVMFAAGAFRNLTASVAPLAEANNYLLPLWMIVLGVTLVLAAWRKTGDG